MWATCPAIKPSIVCVLSNPFSMPCPPSVPLCPLLRGIEWTMCHKFCCVHWDNVPQRRQHARSVLTSLWLCSSGALLSSASCSWCGAILGISAREAPGSRWGSTAQSAAQGQGRGRGRASGTLRDYCNNFDVTLHLLTMEYYSHANILLSVFGVLHVPRNIITV